jgi:Glycosyltransferase like family 2
MVVLDIVLGLTAAVVLAHGLWWTILCVLALPAPRAPRDAVRKLCVAVVVPAHNEEKLVAGCLASLRSTEGANGPEILVVADNCTDKTAEIARAAGATVLVRSEPARRGKGYALEFALANLKRRPTPPDIVAFVDADSRVSSNFYDVLEAAFQGGARAVQVHYLSARAETPLGQLRGLALALVHWSRPLGASRLGLGTTMKGNGMALAWAVARDGLGADGITEDAAMTLALAARGIRVRFAPAARVWGDFPQEYASARTQDERWEGGRLVLIRRAVRTTAGCLLRRDPGCAAASMEVASLPLSSLVVVALIVDTAALAGVGFVPMAVAATLSLVAYLTAGWLAARVGWASLLALVQAPRFIVYKLAIYARLAIGGPRNEWTRTDRT